MIEGMTSARLGLPLMQPGQAQKEMIHNEALAMLDIAVQASVVAAGLNNPPAEPAAGESWIVGSAPNGVWSEAGGSIAGWTAGGWRFILPVEGMSVWNQATASCWQFRAGAWQVAVLSGRELAIGGLRVVGARQPGIANASGGSVTDEPARAVIARILTALRAHGLISIDVS